MSYTSDDIIVLEGLEPVRQRPAMYIGDVGQGGLNCLAVEVIGNAVGEANEGHASLVQVELHDDALTVEDNGRGIPVDGTKLGKSTLELIFTTLHSGCNCGCDHPPGHRNGDQGFGVAIVNALSVWLEVETVRDGQLYRMEFKQGRVTLPLEARGPTDRRGTRITFSPDRSIFGPEPVFDTPWLHDHVRGLSGIPGAQLTLTSTLPFLNRKVALENDIGNERQVDISGAKKHDVRPR